jgi:hypothetical protein
VNMYSVAGDRYFTFNPAAGGRMTLGAISGNAGLSSPRVAFLGGAGSSSVVASVSGPKVIANGSGTWTVNGNVSAYSHHVQSGTLIVKGNLTGTHRPIELSGGTLVINGSLSTPLTWSSTGRLQGNGRSTSTNEMTVPAAGTLAPGNPTGTFTAAHPVTINGNLDITIDGAQNSKLAVTNTLTISNATLNVNVVRPPAGPVIIATYATLSGQFAVKSGIDYWRVDYNYEGANAIALVPPPPGAMLVVR